MRGPMIHHSPAGKPHAERHVNVLEILAEALIEGADAGDRLAAHEEEAAGEPVALEGRQRVAAPIKVAIDDAGHEGAQAEATARMIGGV